MVQGRWSAAMARALELAESGRYGASPNPMVGAVVLDNEGRVVGEGAHLRCGGEHAEIAALTAAGAGAVGGTIVVTLEPCVHHGRTAPCVEAVLAAERQATKDYTQRAEEAAAYGDKGLTVQLEDMVLDESGHAEETERILRDWPL